MMLTSIAKHLQKIWSSFTHRCNPNQEQLVQQVSSLLLENAALKAALAHDTEERKRTENDLRAVQERQAALLNAIPDLMMRFKEDGTYIDIHALDPAMLIADPKDMLGRKLTDFIPPEDAAIHMQHVTEVIQSRKEAVFEFELLLSGVVYDFESRMVPSGANEVLTIVRNITTQKRMQKRDSEFLRDMKALQEIFFTLSQINDMEVLYASMVRLIKENLDIDRVAVFIIDPKTGILNGTYGVGPDGNIRDEHDYREVITEQHWTHDVINSPIRTYLRENIPLYEKGVQIADGCWHTGSALWNGQTAVGFLVTDNLLSRNPPRSYQAEIGSILGNTYGHLIHLKQTQATLAESEEHHRILLNAVPDLVFRLDYAGKFLDYHSSNPNDLVAPPEFFLGRNIVDVMPKNLSGLIEENITRLIQSQTEVAFEYELIVNDVGNQFEARMFPSGESEMMVVIHDVTERKKLEEQSFKLAVETARSKILSEFVQNASHELRTPLSIISNSVFLMNKVTDENKRANYANRVEAQVQQLIRLLDMIIDMTKLDSDVQLDKQSTRPNDLLRHMDTERKIELSQKNIMLTTQLDLAIADINVDQRWLQDALGHIMNNAVRFVPDGGSISLATYSRDTDVVIEITDTGIGMSEDSVPHIFQRFWRQDKAHTTPGFGLGLSIAQKIVEKHDGYIEVKSEEGRGSTFRVVLPAAMPNPVAQ